MPECLFVSDLHGSVPRYRRLFELVEREPPSGLFLGGDLLPPLQAPVAEAPGDFLRDFVGPGLDRLRNRLGEAYPAVFVVLGNDDPRAEEAAVLEIEARGLWSYVHGRRVERRGLDVYGYAYTPPSPFRLKDWERYDVSRYVDPGCVSPEEGARSVAIPDGEARYATIAEDLDQLAGERDVGAAVFLFHAPPYGTALDRAALDGRSVDHVPLDVHVGSIAVRRFVEARQPRLTLHGHVHESARLTGRWREQLGRTWCLSAAHDGPELCVVEFDADDPGRSRRRLLA